MMMYVAEGVTLTNPFGDGRDYMGGELIELSPEKACQWEEWGWVRPMHTQTITHPSPMLTPTAPSGEVAAPTPDAVTAEGGIAEPVRRRSRKGDDAA